MRERVDFDVAQINGPSNIEDCTAIAQLKSIIARAAHVMAEAQPRTAAAAELPRKQGDGTAAADAPEPPAIVEAADSSKDEEIGPVLPPRPEIGTVRAHAAARAAGRAAPRAARGPRTLLAPRTPPAAHPTTRAAQREPGAAH